MPSLEALRSGEQASREGARFFPAGVGSPPVRATPFSASLGIVASALTLSRYPNGAISSEVAGEQEDGTWLWVIDSPTIGE